MWVQYIFEPIKTEKASGPQSDAPGVSRERPDGEGAAGWDGVGRGLSGQGRDRAAVFVG